MTAITSNMSTEVALRMEGEDRNNNSQQMTAVNIASPSVWRARIETAKVIFSERPEMVALRMEGEDRNLALLALVLWRPVALRMEGEDRNNVVERGGQRVGGRPPYGGRG